MSILMTMVAEQMPTTGDSIPLLGVFYLTIMLIILMGTLCTLFILNVQLRRADYIPVSPRMSRLFFHKIAHWLCVRPPTALMELWTEAGVFHKKGLIDLRNKWRIKDSRRGAITAGATADAAFLSVRKTYGSDSFCASSTILEGKDKKESNASFYTDCSSFDVKIRRRCILEWEFMATVLDRILLI
ncbi:hypothetical protein PMAYCL1PPCAC_21330, partial [Pristionchus mayeri]